MRSLIVLAAMAGLASPAFADEVRCATTDASVIALISVEFDADRATGTVSAVTVGTPNFTLATGDSDVLAFAEVAFDRIELGLESPDVGPMSFTLDIVRAATYDGDGGPDIDVVSAGVIAGDSVRPEVVTCTGW